MINSCCVFGTSPTVYFIPESVSQTVLALRRRVVPLAFSPDGKGTTDLRVGLVSVNRPEY